MMRDRSLDIFLAVLFSLSGVAIVTLAWLRPMLLPERVLTTFFGSSGILFALLRVTRFRSPETTDRALPVEVESK